jgi:uncharacterized membrane protein YbaN (DUF454 family)
MVKIVYRYLLIAIAILSIVVGILGIFLPILPGIPFFIIALACFDRSSPAFHRWLLSLPYIGKRLRAWEKEKKIARKRKIQIYLIVLTTFSISIFSLPLLPATYFSLQERYLLQLLLVSIMFIVLFFVYRIDEK